MNAVLAHMLPRQGYLYFFIVYSWLFKYSP